LSNVVTFIDDFTNQIDGTIMGLSVPICRRGIITPSDQLPLEQDAVDEGKRELTNCKGSSSTFPSKYHSDS